MRTEGTGTAGTERGGEREEKKGGQQAMMLHKNNFQTMKPLVGTKRPASAINARGQAGRQACPSVRGCAHVHHLSTRARVHHLSMRARARKHMMNLRNVTMRTRWNVCGRTTKVRCMHTTHDTENGGAQAKSSSRRIQRTDEAVLQEVGEGRWYRPCGARTSVFVEKRRMERGVWRGERKGEKQGVRRKGG